MSAELRVVVVTYSPGETLPRFLDTLATATSAPYHVVIADNGSTDGAVEAALERPEVQVRRTGGNLGFGRAANVGVAGHDGEWVVVANPDVEWAPGSLDVLLEAGARWPAAGCLGPAILTPQGALYPSARAFPSLGRGIAHAVLGPFWPANPWTRAYRAEAGRPTEGTTGWLSGSCLLLRRRAFDGIGGFDPSYFMYCEDMDLCHRLVLAGWQNVYVPSSVITHRGGHATSRAPRAMAAEHHRSLYRYLSRQYDGPAHAPLRLVLRAGLWLRYLVSTRVRSVREGAAPTRSAELLEP